MNFCIFLAVLAAFISSSASFQSPHESVETTDRIVGGQTAERGQFPYIVSIRQSEVFGKIRRHRCGGSIISDRWILTASHCTSGQYASPITLAAHVGAHNISNDGHMHRISRVVNNPLYNSSSRYADLSLLQTTRGIQLNDAVQIIPLNRHIVASGTEAIVSGWGQSQVRRAV